MNFDETPEEAAFREECRSFLSSHAEPKAPGAIRVVMSTMAEDEEAHVKACREWQRTKAEAGWAGLTWPVEFGGRGLTGLLQGIFLEEEARYDVPTGMFAQATGMVGPTIIVHGTEQQKQEFLSPILHGEQVWCQLFSEPNAGSDLASLACRAVRDGDEFVVNGQKVWTSSAHVADWGMLLVRTDLDVPKHKGISYLLLDMRTPGIEVRPLRQATGAAEFNEVFLTDVRVPVANLLGPENAGWGVAMTTLTSERADIGSGHANGFDSVLGLARRFGVTDDPTFRQRLAQLYTSFEIGRYMGYRVRTAASKGIAPGPEVSVMKIAVSERLAFQGDLVEAIQGPTGMLWGEDAPDDGYWQSMTFMGQWMARIGGGTEDVQRNIVGERVLGLPREPGNDRTTAFRDLPH
ncbi:MAG: acyl-CoA dehydrogenase family protein [Acidimicrobiales bacterium]|nr:acyl-CoA dehydrogenase family protein [Acidimicrobiales bacterium]